MTTLKILFLLPLSILSVKTTAQIDDLLKNKDITWVAESYNDFLTERVIGDKIGKEISRVTQLKYLNLKEDATDETFVFQNIFMKAASDGKMPIYSDAECQKVLTVNDIKQQDTLLTIDPTTYETKTRVVMNDIPYENVLFFRVRQVVFYDAKKAQFGLRTLAIAPMVKVTEDIGDSAAWRPIFWTKATDLSKPNKLTNNDVSWAARMVLSGGMDITPNAESSLKVLKIVGEDMPIGHQFNTIQKNFKVPFYHIDQSNPKDKFTINERLALLTNTDTIMTIDPVTYEQRIKVVSSNIESKQIKRLRLVQNWYWNDKKKRLEIYLMATGPLIDVTDYAGNFIYRKPVFYRRTDD
jgi:hypothetical protein